LLFKGKSLYYYLTAAVLIVSLYFVNAAFDKYIIERPRFKSEREVINKFQKEFKIGPRRIRSMDVYNFLFTSVLISGFSIGLRMAGRYQENEKKRKELEKEKLNSELAFLKSQISPHFFFNTLNNIYSLVEINTNDAQKSILQLSKLMRYLLYESEQGNTLLSREVDFMQNYIELMKLRISDKVNLQVKFPESVPEIAIPPLIFIPFIENAFKHGISNRDYSFISISMRVNSSLIHFLCRNSIFPKTGEVAKDMSGIGLDNVKKRLALLFPGKHNLSATETDDSFEISLSIEVDK
jgi:LytS/YehU family sensor histidine kinase